MAAQAAVVLTDAAGTPVNRSFAPQGVDENRVGWWRYLADGTVAAYQWLSQYIREPVPQSDAYKVTFKLEVPVLETVSTTGTSAGYTAGPKVAYTLLANLEFVLPSRSSLQDRKDLRAMVYDLLQESVATDAIWNLERAW